MQPVLNKKRQLFGKYTAAALSLRYNQLYIKKINGIILLMYSFLLLSIPSLLVCYINSRKDYKARAFILPVLIGLFTGIIICFFKEFFIFSGKVHYLDFNSVFKNYFLGVTFIPSAFVMILLYLSKDSFSYKAQAVFPLLAALHGIIIPYTVIKGSDTYSFFQLFSIPLLYILMDLHITLLFTRAEKLYPSNKVLAIVLAVLSLTAFLIPPYIITIWEIRNSVILCTVETLIYFIIVAVLVFFSAAESFLHSHDTKAAVDDEAKSDDGNQVTVDDEAKSDSDDAAETDDETESHDAETNAPEEKSEPEKEETPADNENDDESDKERIPIFMSM